MARFTQLLSGDAQQQFYVIAVYVVTGGAFHAVVIKLHTVTKAQRRIGPAKILILEIKAGIFHGDWMIVGEVRADMLDGNTMAILWAA